MKINRSILKFSFEFHTHLCSEWTSKIINRINLKVTKLSLLNGIIRIGITMVNFLIERGKCFIKLTSHSVFIVTVINFPAPIKAMRESLPFFNFDIVQICSRLESCYATCAHWVHSAQSRMPGLTPGAAPGHTESILSRFHHPDG